MVKRKVILAIIVVLAAGLIAGLKIKPMLDEKHDKTQVEFKDNNMGQTICNKMQMKNLNYGDLKKLSTLYTDYVGYYSTLKDLSNCENIEDLLINWGIEDKDIDPAKMSGSLTQEKIDSMQDELKSILPRLKKLTDLRLGYINQKDVDWSSIDFVKGLTNLDSFYIYNCSATDYSAIKTCKNLTSISLESSQISKADDITGLSKLEFINICYTPLSKNEAELKKLREAYPQATIYIDKNTEY